MIPVLWHKGNGNWDTAFPRYVLDNCGQCDHLETLLAAKEVPQSSAVICIPGRHSVTEASGINREAANFEQVTFVIYGDEEGLFRPELLDHKNMRVWYFMPPWNPKSEVDHVAINGWPHDCRQMLIVEREKLGPSERDFDWCFAGQVTHLRREQCADAAKGIPRGFWLGTHGFSQGIPRNEYYRTLLCSKIALCPSGPCTPDSFRIAEALESGCIPIADGLTQDPKYPPGYWNYAFETYKLPFPVIDDWRTLPAIVEKVLYDYAHYYFACAKFWAEYKARLFEWMKEDLRR